MTKVIVKIDKDFTVIPNEIIRNKEMSANAKMILITMLSLPPEWNFSINGLTAVVKEGRDAVRSAISEIERFGYITRERERKENGTLGAMVYTVYQYPVSEKPVMGEPRLENPTQAKPILGADRELNTDKLNTNKLSINNNSAELNNSSLLVKEVQTQKTQKREFTFEERKELLTDMIERVKMLSLEIFKLGKAQSDNIADCVKYFVEQYYKNTGNLHPVLKNGTLRQIIERLINEYSDEYNHTIFCPVSDIEGNEDYKYTIDKYFKTDFGELTNYNLPHFATEGILKNLMLQQGMYM